jgi:predicted acetyltransferase
MTDTLSLRRPQAELMASYLGSIAEMRAIGETIWPGWVPDASESAAAFAARVRRAAHDPLPPMVRSSIYWATRGDTVVGRIALRHRLTPSLEAFGGHIGYEVRPSCRRQGVGRAMLRQLLNLPEARAIGRLLLTCAPDNVGSNRTILANGGVLARTALAPERGRQTNYYWVDLR